MRQYLPRLADMGMDLVKFLMNVLISLAAAVYILLDKEKALMGIRKLNYSLFSTDAANYLSLYSRDVRHVFEQYIVGNLIDSFIVGVITYIGCLLMGFPYAPMFAFVVGITNVIPVFGPFLGAIPVIIILPLIKPWYAPLFAVFILVSAKRWTATCSSPSSSVTNWASPVSGSCSRSPWAVPSSASWACSWVCRSSR